MSKLRWRQIGGKTAHGGKTERLFYGAPATRAAASSSHLLVHAGRWSCDGQVVWARASLFVVRVFMHQFSPVQCEPRQLHAANLCLLFVRGRQSFDAHSAWALATLFGTDVSLLTPIRQIFPVVCACVSHLTPMQSGLWQLFLGRASFF